MTATLASPARGFGARIARSPIHVVLLVVSVIWMLPVLGLVVSSFRPGPAVSATGWWRLSVGELTFENYRRVFARNGLFTSMVNSFAIAVPATALTICIAAVAAYGLARFQFRLHTPILMLLIGLLVVPAQITLVPLLRLFNTFELTGTFRGVWFVHVGYSLPFAIYLLHNFFSELPSEIFEAASVDGANDAQIFFRMVLPLSRPAIASLAIFEFVWNWNDLLVALIFLGGNRDVAPLTVTVSTMVASRGEGWQVLTSAAVVSVVVPMVVFLSAQRHFVRGLLAGTTKG